MTRRWSIMVKLMSALALLISSVHAISKVNASKENSRTDSEYKKITVDELFAEDIGTFILRDIQKETTFVYNKKRANKRFAPQATFNVLNSLIGLQVGAVKDEYDIKYWDGIKRKIPVWNQDHTLGTAMKKSVSWYYQTMAINIGENRMKEWIQKIPYGNQDISGEIDQFWLSSSLEISALEQANFMENLYEEKLPFDVNVMKTVKRIMIQKEDKNFTLYGKTGQGSGLGWYIGFIETSNRTYCFATNIDGTSAEAKRITLDILEKNNIIKE